MRSPVPLVLFGILVAVVPCIGLSADSSEPRIPLTGAFRLAGPIRFGDIDDGSSHFYFYLSGDVAKLMYDSLKAKPVENECGDGLVKRAGALECMRSSNEYRCEFSLEHETLDVEIATTC